MKTVRFFNEAKLMLEAIPFVAEESYFALKGETAINFFNEKWLALVNEVRTLFRAPLPELIATFSLMETIESRSRSLDLSRAERGSHRF